MGLTVKSDDNGVMVFANQKEKQDGTKYTLYSIGVSSKDKDKNWVSGYLNVRFKSGVEVANKSKIKINNAFPVVSKSGDKTYVSFMITDFDVLESADNNDGFIDMSNIKDDELPFAD